LASKIYKAIASIWKKNKEVKPAIIKAGSEPEYKHPKGVISFKISDEEESKLEITNEMSDKEIKLATETYLKLVKMQFKHRIKEIELKKKLKK